MIMTHKILSLGLKRRTFSRKHSCSAVRVLIIQEVNRKQLSRGSFCTDVSHSLDYVGRSMIHIGVATEECFEGSGRCRLDRLYTKIRRV